MTGTYEWQNRSRARKQAATEEPPLPHLFPVTTPSHPTRNSMRDGLCGGLSRRMVSPLVVRLACVVPRTRAYIFSHRKQYRTHEIKGKNCPLTKLRGVLPC